MMLSLELACSLGFVVPRNAWKLKQKTTNKETFKGDRGVACVGFGNCFTFEAYLLALTVLDLTQDNKNFPDYQICRLLLSNSEGMRSCVYLCSIV